jgi:hypothetical protein
MHPAGSAGSADQYGGEPLSFSLAGSVTTDGETLRKNFPKILEAAQLVADLKEGEMLYLPSGWFHEVQSFSSAGGQDTGVPVLVLFPHGCKASTCGNVRKGNVRREKISHCPRYYCSTFS